MTAGSFHAMPLLYSPMANAPDATAQYRAVTVSFRVTESSSAMCGKGDFGANIANGAFRDAFPLLG